MFKFAKPITLGENPPTPEPVVHPKQEYVEPSEKEMKALFNRVGLPKGFSTFEQDVIVLPVSLVEYRKLWYDQDGPMFAGDFLKDKHKNNRVTE